MHRCRLVAVVVVAVVFALLAYSATVVAVEVIKAKDGSGIPGYKDTPVQPWSGYHVHDPDRPAPRRVQPGISSGAPSDAAVLFDGTDLSKWERTTWKIEDEELVAVSGNLTTKESFGDCQLHLEWQAPDPPVGDDWDHGNNGVMLMGLFEIQIFDTYTTPLYPDGQAASVYAQTPPLVNACRKPGQWQSYDIIFYTPVFKDASSSAPPASRCCTTVSLSTTTRRSTARPTTAPCRNTISPSSRNVPWSSPATTTPSASATSGSGRCDSS